MKRIDPLGRNPLSGGINPLACFCSPGDTYSSGKGSNDNCDNCGCACDYWYTTNTTRTTFATEVDRASV
jgi:putative bacteriocin precursor